VEAGIAARKSDLIFPQLCRKRFFTCDEPIYRQGRPWHHAPTLTLLSHGKADPLICRTISHYHLLEKLGGEDAF
jgi:hypothetical protein